MVLNRTVLVMLVLLVWAGGTLTGATLQSRQNLTDRIADAQVRSDEARQREGATQAMPLPTSPVPAPPNTTPILPPPPAQPVPPPPPPRPVTVAGTPCLSTVRACVRLSTKQAWLISGGKVILGPVSITSGKKGERTPTGMHQVQWKDADHKSEEFDDAPMPWSVFFADGGIAFHTGSLSAQSSGCIHLANSVAKRFFGFLQVGDPVQVLR